MPFPSTELIATEVAWLRVPSGQSVKYEVPSKSRSSPMQPATVGPGKHGGSSESPSAGSKCPISIEKLTLACRAAQETKLPNFAVSNSGWKLKLVPAQVFGSVVWEPLCALAIMNPD